MVLRFNALCHCIPPAARDGGRSRLVAVVAMAMSLGAISEIARAQWEDPPTPLLASDGAVADENGLSVDLSGDVAILGAPLRDELGPDSGAAYVCRLTAGNWNEEQKVAPTDGAANDQFGCAVAVSGEFVFVGAHNHAGHGAAYVFRFNGASWIQDQKLMPADLASGDSFGWDLASSGDVVLVAAHLHNDYAGAVYVYRYNGANWIQEEKITPPPSAGYGFGSSVAVCNNVAVIGNDLNGVNGPSSGAAYVFRYDGAGWVEEQMIFAADGSTNEKFSFSLDVFEDVIVAGTPGDDDNGATSGSAFVFRFGGHFWSQEAKLLASDGGGGDKFGTSVSISGNLIAVGAPTRDVWEPIWFPNYGAAYAFRYSGATWSEEGILLDPDGWSYDEAGRAVSMSGTTVLVGSHLSDVVTNNAGKAVVFEGEPVDPGSCPADINGDGVVDVADFLDLLADWGAAGGPSDIDGDGVVGIGDFLELLANWGPCP